MNQNVTNLFKAIDSKNATEFAKFLTDDGVFRYGNYPDVAGKENVEKFVAGFFESIKALSHTLNDIWEVDGARIVAGMVTYTRHNGTQLTVPFCNVLKMQGELVQQYLVHIDTSQLYV